MNKRDHVLNAVLLSVGLGALLGVVPSNGVVPDGGSPPATLVAAVQGALVEVIRIGVPVTLGALFPDVDTAFGRHRKSLHNVFVLAVFVAYPFAFGNLEFVWIGVLTHFVLDFTGSARGLALFYPLSDQEFDLPGGVPTSSRWAMPLTVAITLVELGVLAALHYYVVPLDASVDVARQAFVG
jgi:membrane-bound metal-dependent hydrolase YbcI (DUF457 family)